MYTVFGAGSVGTVLAALLSDAGIGVCIAGRGAVPDLRAEGDDETVETTVEVADSRAGEGTDAARGTILLCVHEPDIDDLRGGWRGRRVVSFANGVRRFDGIRPAVWRMTCTLVQPGFARFTRRGRVILPRDPEDGGEPLADDLRRAGLDVAVSDDIDADRWLKFFVNLASAPNALVRREDHDLPEFGALKAALLEEARARLHAAGIEARSCDGRDPSLEQEIERQRSGGGRRRPVYNSTWRQLSLGRRPKERYHDTIAALGPAPRNAAMLRLLDEADRPECYGAAELLRAILEA